MKIEFDMVADPVLRAKLEALDFDPEVAERLALELLELVRRDISSTSIHINLGYDEENGNRVVSYEITGLPAYPSEAGQA